MCEQLENKFTRPVVKPLIPSRPVYFHHERAKREAKHAKLKKLHKLRWLQTMYQKGKEEDVEQKLKVSRLGLTKERRIGLRRSCRRAQLCQLLDARRRRGREGSGRADSVDPRPRLREVHRRMVLQVDYFHKPRLEFIMKNTPISILIIIIITNEFVSIE